MQRTIADYVWHLSEDRRKKHNTSSLHKKKFFATKYCSWKMTSSLLSHYFSLTEKNMSIMTRIICVKKWKQTEDILHLKSSIWNKLLPYCAALITNYFSTFCIFMVSTFYKSTSQLISIEFHRQSPDLDSSWVYRIFLV